MPANPRRNGDNSTPNPSPRQKSRKTFDPTVPPRLPVHSPKRPLQRLRILPRDPGYGHPVDLASLVSESAVAHGAAATRRYGPSASRRPRPAAAPVGGPPVIYSVVEYPHRGGGSRQDHARRRAPMARARRSRGSAPAEMFMPARRCLSAAPACAPGGSVSGCCAAAVGALMRF